MFDLTQGVLTIRVVYETNIFLLNSQEYEQNESNKIISNFFKTKFQYFPADFFFS